MSFLKVEDLHIRLGQFCLSGVSLELNCGSYLTIIGPTGSGKTILLECLIGFYIPEQGRIFMQGRDITRELPEKRGISIVYQDYALLPHLSVFENIAYGLKKKGTQDLEAKVVEMGKALHIDHLFERRPDTLSGGEQQRTALARALVVRPNLLLMDEPFSALDPKTRRETRKLLRKVIAEQQTTVIHITHDMDDAWSLADRVAFLRQGELLQYGSLEDIFHRPCSKFIAEFVGVTVLDGIVQNCSQGVSRVKVDGFELESIDLAEVGEKVRLAIRPEDIMLARSRPQELSAQNVLEARVEDMHQEGFLQCLFLAVGSCRFHVLITSNAFEHLKLDLGSSVFALIKSSCVRIV